MRLLETEVRAEAAAETADDSPALTADQVACRVFDRLRDIQDNTEAGLANGYVPFEGSISDAVDVYAEKTLEMERAIAGATTGLSFLTQLNSLWTGERSAEFIEASGKGVTTFETLGIEQRHVNDVGKLAQENSVVGEVADYIPGLGKVVEDGTAEKVAIVAVDPEGKKLEFGDGLEVRFSAQSTIKPLLYLYALFQGIKSSVIAGVEPTARKFNDDPVLDLARMIQTAEHPLNNAGGISSAGAIGGDFNGFLRFMRILTGNPELGVDDSVYRSEKRKSGGNRTIAHALERRGRFGSEYEADRALDNYTRACSINVTAEEIARAYQVVASGGMKDGKQIIPKDLTVPVLAAMGSFGLYDQHAKMALLEAGATMLTAKSGVAGAVVNVMPAGVVYVTFSPYLDSAGNSVFGMVAGVALNRLFAGNPNMLRFSPAESDRRLQEYLEAEAAAVIASKRAQPKKDPRMFRIPEDALRASVAAAVHANLNMLPETERAALVGGLK